ncbi:MAG: hypothetical protein QNJ77_15550 [Acidimicrobiia bacterium]|nr:hypothetical protein [Acidimicrobiia bacterium]
MEERTSSDARILLDDEGIIHVIAIGVPSTAPFVDETFAVVRELAGGQRAPILFDARDWPRGTPASWARFISKIESICLAAAVVADTRAAKALGRFPEFLDDLLIPFRVFPDEEPALEFLRGYLPD